MRSPLPAVAAALFLLAAVGSAIAEDPPRGVRPGRDTIVRGEVVEVSCYLRDGRRGESHKPCALTCLKNGGQLGIVEDDSGTLYPLAGAAPATDPSAALREHIAEHVAVRGRVYERAGGRVLVADDVERLP